MQCFVLQVYLVFNGNILTIQIFLYAVFNNFNHIFMYASYCVILGIFCHMMVLGRFKILILKVHITYSICGGYGINTDQIAVYGNFGDGGKVTQRSPPEALHYE